MSNPLSKAARRTISEKPKSEVCQWGGERRGRKDPVVTMPYFGQIQESQNTDGPVPRLGEPQLSRFRARSLRLASLQPTGRIVPVCLRLRSAAPAAGDTLLRAPSPRGNLPCNTCIAARGGFGRENSSSG